MEIQPKDTNAIINDCDIIKTVVIGTKNGKRIEYSLEMIYRPVKEWPELMGAQVYIGGAPAWTVELMRRGLIDKRSPASGTVHSRNRSLKKRRKERCM